MFSSTPNWLKFKRWRSRRQPADADTADESAQVEDTPRVLVESLDDATATSAATTTTTTTTSENLSQHCDVSRTNQAAKQARGRTRIPSRTKTKDGQQEAQTGRRLALLPRSLVGLIERAISPAASGSHQEQQHQTSSSSPDRPKSPLRKLRKSNNNKNSNNNDKQDYEDAKRTQSGHSRRSPEEHHKQQVSGSRVRSKCGGARKSGKSDVRVDLIQSMRERRLMLILLYISIFIIIPY